MLTIESGPPGVVTVQGRLDAAQSPAAQAFLDGVTGSVMLDCAGLEYISSAGLGVLLKTQKRLRATGGGVKLAGVSPHVHDIFKYAGFDQIFDISSAP